MRQPTTIYLLLLLCIHFTGCNRVNYDYASEINVRIPPLRDILVSDTIRVSNFGAIPDDEYIDTKEIQMAIDSANKLGGKVMILFEPGIYRLDAFDRRNALEISNATEIVLEGNGAKFMMTRPEILFLKIFDSKRVIVSNLEVNYEISPFTQGWVTEVNPDEKWLKVKIDPGWPSPGNDNFRNADYKWAFIKDKNNLPAFKEGTEFRLYLNDWEKLEGNIWIYHTSHTSKLKTVEVGDPFVQISRVDGCLISASNSEDITLKNLRLIQSPACMLGSSNTSRMNYLDIDMSPAPGNWMSAGADGCFNVNGREGPWVEGCTFNALGDDNLIIKGTGAYIIDVINDTTFAVVNARHRFVYPPLSFETYSKRDSISKWVVTPGDKLEIVDPLKKSIIAEPLVTAVEVFPDYVLVTVDQKVPGIRAGVSSDSSITVFNQSNSLQGFVVKNNQFFNAPRFGFLLKSHDGIIEGNHFKNHSDQSITMINTYQEFGGRAYNILIKNNIFEGAGGWPVKTAETAQHKLARPNGRNIFSIISAAFTIPGGQYNILETETIALHNLYFIENKFINWRQLPALTVMNARHVIIQGNEFVRDKSFVETDTLWLNRKIIRILYSEDVEIGAQKFDNNKVLRDNIEIIDSKVIVNGAR